MNLNISSPGGRSAALVVAALLLCTGLARAGADLNEVGAVLVYPVIVGVPGQETFVTVTNAGAYAVKAHISYINGDPTPISQGGAGYCYACDFSIPLTPNDTETLVIGHTPNGIAIQSEDSALSMSCPYPFGMIVVNLEDATGQVLTDNVLLGEEVVVDYQTGSTYSIPAISFQGRNGGNGDGTLSFDDKEYAKFPRIVAANFIAPNLPQAQQAISAELALFTLGFDRQFPPRVDCSVVGYDAGENPFSASMQFGCWTMRDLCQVSPEFCYPNLGLYGTEDTHGWLLLNCRVDQDSSGGYESSGGVHGVLIQSADPGAAIRRNDASADAMSSPGTWARLLHQSVTTGDDLQLHIGYGIPGLD